MSLYAGSLSQLTRRYLLSNTTLIHGVYTRNFIIQLPARFPYTDLQGNARRTFYAQQVVVEPDGTIHFQDGSTGKAPMDRCIRDSRPVI